MSLRNNFGSHVYSLLDFSIDTLWFANGLLRHVILLTDCYLSPTAILAVEAIASISTVLVANTGCWDLASQNRKHRPPPTWHIPNGTFGSSPESPQ